MVGDDGAGVWSKGAFSGGVDVSEFEAYWQLADEVVREIRMRILERTRLTASAGQLKGISWLPMIRTWRP